MKQLKEMPEQGQFIVTWEEDRKLWSGTYKVENKKLYEYFNGEFAWYTSRFFSQQTNMKFFVKD